VEWNEVYVDLLECFSKQTLDILVKPAHHRTKHQLRR